MCRYDKVFTFLCFNKMLCDKGECYIYVSWNLLSLPGEEQLNSETEIKVKCIYKFEVDIS